MIVLEGGSGWLLGVGGAFWFCRGWLHTTLKSCFALDNGKRFLWNFDEKVQRPGAYHALRRGCRSHGRSGDSGGGSKSWNSTTLGTCCYELTLISDTETYCSGSRNKTG